MRDTSLHGAGLGLRRELIPDLKAADLANLPDAIDFCELAPEIWLDMGGSRRKEPRHFTGDAVRHVAMVCTRRTITCRVCRAHHGTRNGAHGAPYECISATGSP